MSSPALALDGIVKAFDGLNALNGAAFSSLWGEVHALLGENGAGKTSLMNVACGLYAPDGGRIEVDGRQARLRGPADARALGVGMVHQHFKLVRPFTVAENVMLARPQRSWRRGRRLIARDIERFASELDFAINPRARVADISVAEQQRVEIVKVLVSGARILILDEPTSVLTDEESARLLSTMRRLAARGASVVLITHKLREALKYSDRVTVMRAGRTLASGPAAELSAPELTRLMVGSTITDTTPPARAAGEMRLEVMDVHATRGDGAKTLSGASLAVRAGEIYGVAGVGGNGQTELAEVLMGLREPLAGKVRLGGRDITKESPRARRLAGLVSIPADRFAYGLAGNLSVMANFAVWGVQAGRYGGFGWTQTGAMRRETDAAIRAFDIQGARPHTPARMLSGGNAQKLVLARELSGQSRVILAHSPTHGLDVRACAAIHDHLRRARDAGAAVLLISEDLDELLGLSDRVGVINRGRIVGELERPVDRHAVGALMVGHA